MRDYFNIEIMNILFVLFIFNLLVEILCKIIVMLYLKFYLYVLFIYFDRI